MIQPIIILSVLVSLLLFPTRITYEIAPPETIELPSALKKICACESTGSSDNEPRHYDADGSVLRGKVNPHDIGMCQISETYWGEKAQELGLDIFTEEGNKEMANYIFERHGAKPWKWSAGCHGEY